MKTLLVDLDDTLLDYSGGVDDCWTEACRTIAPAGMDAASLVESVRAARRWFWDDPERHRELRTRPWPRPSPRTLRRAAGR
jgi:putative hydrolase of the HAD superfamily